MKTHPEAFAIDHHGKEYRIYRRPGQNKYSIRVQFRGKDYVKSLGTYLPKIAETNARHYLDSLFGEQWDQVAALRLRAEKAFCTIGELLERYRQHAGHLDKKTVGGNIGALRGIVAIRTEGDPDRAEKLRSDSLTAGLVAEWLAGERKKGRADHSIRQTFAQARSLFRDLAIFEGLRLPDLTGFLAQPAFRVGSKGARAFVPIPEATIAAMEKVAAGFAPGLWLTYMLMSRLGLRNAEVEFARWTWFEVTPDGGAILTIKDRPQEGFAVKNAVARALTVDAALWAGIQQRREAGDYVIAAAHPTERYDITHREINEVLRPFLPDREKGAYELRKWAGSVVATKRGIYLAQRFLGHASVTTTEAYYATYLRTIGNVSASELGEIYPTEQK